MYNNIKAQGKRKVGEGNNFVVANKARKTVPYIGEVGDDSLPPAVPTSTPPAEPVSLLPLALS